MKEFCRNLTLLIVLSIFAVVLNVIHIFVDHWVLTCIVIIDEIALIICFLLWKGQHIMPFVKTLVRDYKKIRDDLRGKR